MVTLKQAIRLRKETGLSLYDARLCLIQANEDYAAALKIAKEAVKDETASEGER